MTKRTNHKLLLPSAQKLPFQNFEAMKVLIQQSDTYWESKNTIAIQNKGDVAPTFWSIPKVHPAP